MTEPLPIDDLIVRLRARAADPERRTSTRPSQLVAGVRTMNLGGLLSMGRSLGSLLGGVVQANREGRVDPAGHAAALDIERQLSTPAPSVLPAPADERHLAAIEGRLGVSLPPALRRVYAEVADGGFGPGEGLLPLSEVAAQYEELRSAETLPRDRSWPDGLLPMVSMDPGWDCVEAPTGRVVAWDPEDLDERVSDRVWAASFRVVHPTVEAWLSDWVTSKTQAEAQADMMARFMSPEYQVKQAREAREAIGKLSLEERRAMGLPDVGWESVVWGGIGWEEPEREGDAAPG
jgi:hypothetical protein